MIDIFTNIKEVESYVYESYMKASKYIKAGLPDKETRNPKFTRMLLDKLGKPDQNLYNILVTGSKGKGSISRIVSSLLQAHGYKTGLFTSPHLINFKERIRINGVAILDEELIKYANYIKPFIAEIQKNLPEDQYIGPVGISAVIAILYYRDNETQYNVIECGKGARYDDVNTIFSKASIINPVFEEHIPNLGNDIREIAYNKAGVIKETQDFVFSAHQGKEVVDAIKYEAMAKNVDLFSYGEDFVSSNIRIDPNGTYFDVRTKDSEYRNLKLRLLGRHQAYNAALAIAVVEKIIGGVDEDIVRACFENLTWPGRLEIISKNPTVILDGCINRECSKYIVEVLEEMGGKDITFIIGIPDDKDYMGVIQSIDHLASNIILTRTKNQHLKFIDNQYIEVKQIIGDKIYFEKTMDEAMGKANSIVSSDDIICIIGTQSLVKDTKELFNQDTLNLE